MPYYEEPTPELIKLHEEYGYYPKPDDFEPNPDYPKDHHWYGKLRCHAWNAFHGRQCLGLAMVSLGIHSKTGKPFDKCKTHGGKALRGIENPSFTTGRYSASLPTRLQARYEQLGNDRDLMDMRSRAQLLETRIDEIVSGLDEVGSFGIFKELKRNMDDYEKYIQLASSSSGDRAINHRQKAVTALSNVSRLINAGTDEGEKWQEIQNIIETIRRLADTEQKQIKTAENTVMIDRVMVFATVMGSIFRDTVMSISNLPLDSRKSIIASVEGQVSQLLQQGNYPEIVDGEFDETTT